ncbi:unnamed protein product, partial [Brachionus calyciflorus]
MSKRRAEALRTKNKRSSSNSNTQRSSLIDEPSTSSATMTSLNNEDSYVDSNQERELQQTYSMNLDSQNSDLQSEKNIFKNFILLSKDGLKSVYKCKLCTRPYSVHGDSDANLRKPLGSNKHQMEVLYKSQIKKVDLSNDQEVECDPEKRKIINEAILDCILIDSRPFSDFSKPGMMKLIDVIIPGYKPPSRTTISRRLESEFIKY